MLSNKQKRVLFQILPFGAIPALFSAVHVILEKGILGDHPVYPSTGNPFDTNIFISVLTSLVIGFLIGFFEVFYVNVWFQNKSFVQKILFKSIVYIIAITIAALIIIVGVHTFNQKVSPFNPEVGKFVSSFFSNFVFWSIICYYSLAILISLFYKEVSDNVGHAISLNFFTGKYHQPKSEHRVFMFLDMKSSTAHAEKLGHINYFQMLKEYYDDLSQPILDFGGEIYQYVGDEIVITWNAKNDFAERVLDCFFAMRSTLVGQQDKYVTKYGIAPTFKAGLHFGQVTTGEIGSLKKDIVFTGDTLNTTARIRALCNQYDVDLLVSEVFLHEVKSKNHYKIQSMGKVHLRGRHQQIELFGIQPI